MKRTFSFWEREEWMNPPDLLITGGGIVGASIALFYKERHPDTDILVVDKGFAPEGASTRNAGFTCIGSISEHLADMEIAGEETVLNRIERRWHGLNLLKKTMGEETIGYEHTGGYEIFTDKKIFDECGKRIPEMNERLKERLGIKDVYKARIYEGYPAIFNHVEGAINSGKLMRNLHRRLAQAGVRTWWNCKVESIAKNYVKFESGFELAPENIVLATNGFSSRLADLSIKPARGFVFVTQPIKKLKWRGTFNFNKGYVYFRNVDDRLLIGGARDVAKNEETTDQFGRNEKIRDWLISFTNDVIKLPAGWEIDIEWSGIMGFTENKEPFIGQIQPGIWAAAGLSGMGIAIGMEVARGLVEKMD
ncbi:MAG: FAD-dependent oxidoreductase [Balneolaceae bacterium]